MTGWIIAIIVICSLLALALVALFVVLSNKWLVTTRYDFKFAAAPERGVKIVHLSDLHAAVFGKDNSSLMKKIAREEPDFIAVTGDVIHAYRKRDVAVAQKTVKSLRAIAPVYIVSGNHEMRSRKWREFKPLLENCGARVLDNEVEEVCGISLCGVNCASLKNGTPFELADGAKGFKLLLAHKPEFIHRYSLAGYDLALCGHAHGGQWRLPFTEIGVYSPGQGLFPKYTGGVHTCGNMKEVISRGLGNSECPLRLFNRPEIVVVTINRDIAAENEDMAEAEGEEKAAEEKDIAK